MASLSQQRGSDVVIGDEDWSGPRVLDARLQPGRSPRVMRLLLADGGVAWLKDHEGGRAEAGHEHAALSAVGRLLGRRVVPSVLHHDTARGRLLLSDVSRGQRSVLERTVARQVSPTDAFRLGHALGQLHRAGEEAPLRSLLPDGAAQASRWRSRIEAAVPEAAGLLRESERFNAALIHGDPSPDDFYVAEHDLRFVDLEQAGAGDPARDLGLLLARWLQSGADMDLIAPFLRAYPDNDAALLNRAARYAGLAVVLSERQKPAADADRLDLGRRLIETTTTPITSALRAFSYFLTPRAA